MRRQRKPQRRCTKGRKHRYRDRVAALHALATIQNRDKQGALQTRAYWCLHCKGWHLTSKEKR